MTERERLIELLKNVQSNYSEDIADYLLANGMIVPPCKVGDVVYSYSKEFGTILAYFVEQIEISYDTDNKCGLWVYEANCVETGDLLDSIDFYSEDIGKNVFFTREEAEQALKEEQNHD